MRRYPPTILQQRVFLGLLLVSVVCLAVVNNVHNGLVKGFGLRRIFSVFEEDRDLVNRTWLEQRQRLLADPNNVKKVVIFAYMRGGSSLIGDTLGNDEDSFYWYEPLDQFYNDYLGYKTYSIPLHITYSLEGKRRVPEAAEAQRVAQFMSDLYYCRLDKLPREMLIHKFMSRSPNTLSLDKCERRLAINACKSLLPAVCSGDGVHRRDTVSAISYNCSQRIDQWRNNTIDLTSYMEDKMAGNKNATSSEGFVYHEYCMRLLKGKSTQCVSDNFKEDACKNRTMQVSKVLRANMETMETILQTMPDVHVLHYFRDPRAIGMSVQDVPLISFRAQNDAQGLLTEITMLCRKMEADITIRKRLERTYPGAFATLSYEGLVSEPWRTLDGVYTFLGREVPGAVLERLQRAFYNKESNNNRFSVTRRNATQTSTAWKANFPKSQLLEANELCRNVLHELGYPLDISGNLTNIATQNKSL